jgi:glycosyltransferase involved in cell wall biosynthesis
VPTRPRVLHVIDSLRLGGAEALLDAVVRELGRAGRSWNAVCVPRSDDADPGLVASLHEHADAFRWLPAAPLYDPRLPIAVGGAVRGYRAQVVHSHLSTANISSRAAAVTLRRPHMTTIHTVPGAAAEDTRLRAAADGWSSWLSRRIVAPSGEVADAFARRFRLPAERFRVIPNAPAAQPPGPGFDRARLRREVAGTGMEKLVVSVARLQPEKGIDDLLSAAVRLCARLPGLRIAVVGSGPEEGALRAQIDQAGLSGSVRLLGSRADVGCLLAAADAFCLPSRHEGLPISLLEAMQAGLPCVATRVGGVPGLVSEGVDGLLTAAGDPLELAAALERVLTDAELARSLGHRARALVEESYGIAAVSAAYADLYDELAGAGSR